MLEKKQVRRLLERLITARKDGLTKGDTRGWVSLNDLLYRSNLYIGRLGARVFDIRKKLGYDSIEQDNFEGESHYRLTIPRAMIDLDNLKIINKKQTALPL